MGIASFAIGILSLIFIPFFSIYMLIPSLVSLILGIIDTVLRTKEGTSKGLSIAGIVLSSISFFICVIILIGVILYNTLVSDSDIIENNTTGLVTSSEIVVNYGETATVDNISITYLDLDIDFEDYEEYAYIPDGYKVLKAEFEIENIGNSYEYVSYYYFDCFADNLSCDVFYYVDDYYFSESLYPGEKISVSVYFEIPEDAKNIDIEFDPNTTTDSKISFPVLSTVD